MSELIIRKAELSDSTDMAEIEKLCFSEPWSKESIEERLRIAEDKSHELAKTVKSGDYLPAYAAEDGKQEIKNDACRYCPYFVMCRRRELVNTWDEDDEEGETNE